MAVLTNLQYVKVWEDGLSDKTALYALRNVTTADTANLAGDFSSVKRAIIMGTTVNGNAVAAVSGTTATMPTGLAADAGYLLAWGCAA